MSLRKYPPRVKTLATLSYAGLTFHVVLWRQHESNKPWRGYLALLYDGFEVATSIGANVSKPSDVAFCANYWRGMFARVYRRRDTAATEILEWIADAQKKESPAVYAN